MTLKRKKHHLNVSKNVKKNPILSHKYYQFNSTEEIYIYITQRTRKTVSKSSMGPIPWNALSYRAYA